MHYLWCSWPVQNDLKYTETSFSPISRHSFALQVAQGPRSPKLVIFVRTMTDIQTDCFTPCACAQGKYLHLGIITPRACTRGNCWTWLTSTTDRAFSFGMPVVYRPHPFHVLTWLDCACSTSMQVRVAKSWSAYSSEFFNAGYITLQWLKSTWGMCSREL